MVGRDCHVGFVSKRGAGGTPRRPPSAIARAIWLKESIASSKTQYSSLRTWSAGQGILSTRHTFPEGCFAARIRASIGRHTSPATSKKGLCEVCPEIRNRGGEPALHQAHTATFATHRT